MKKIMLSIRFMSFLCVCNLSAESKIVKMVGKQMVEIPGKSFLMMRTEVTQELYEAVMGENPSQFKGKNKPVDSVDISDILIFCNKLSEMCGLRPVYLINGETDFRKINHYEMKRIVYIHQYYFWCD